MTDSQSEIDIRTAVRTRPAMYFGCTTERGVVHVVNELVSNGIDLFLHDSAQRVSVAVDGDTINYSDDGPGLPYDVPGAGNISFAEHYLTRYHTTPTADDHAPHIHLLSHGLGLVCVNAVSEHLTVKTWRSGRLWEQHFARGLPVHSPQIVEQGCGKGTCISFRLDSEVFKAKLPCARTLRRLIFEAAHLFPGITLALGREVFHAPNGLADLASLYYLRVEPSQWQEPVPFALHACCDDVEVNVGILGETSAEPFFRSWANGSSTGLHGTHLDGLRDALRSVQWVPAVAMIHVIMHQPEFAGPTRCRLANPLVRKIVRECVKPALHNWKSASP
jgi:DNA gyrase subunit B